MLDKLTADNTNARRIHLGEPNPGHSNLSLMRRHDRLCEALGMAGPHSTWLKPLKPDTGERFLYDFYQHSHMDTITRATAALELVEEVGVVEEEDGGGSRAGVVAVTAAADDDSSAGSDGDDAELNAVVANAPRLQPKGSLASDLDLEFAPFQFKKPPKLSRPEKIAATKTAAAETRKEFEALDAGVKSALFLEGGLIYGDCSPELINKVLNYVPGKKGYCVYDGPCFAAFPNLTINKRSQKKRAPRCHKRDCLQEQATLIYEKRFPSLKKRKRRRDGT